MPPLIERLPTWDDPPTVYRWNVCGRLLCLWVFDAGPRAAVPRFRRGQHGWPIMLSWWRCTLQLWPDKALS
jgi:hypothetical protein